MDIAITKFKANALTLLDRIHRNGKPITVLKRGKPLVKIIPVANQDQLTDLAGTVRAQDDDLFSTGETWLATSEIGGL